MGNSAISVIILFILFAFGAYLVFLILGWNIGSFSFDFSNIPILSSIQDFIVHNFVSLYRFVHG